MAEIIGTLRVAAELLHFVQWGIRIVTTAHDLKKNKDGAQPSNVELEILSKELARSMRNIQSSHANAVTPELGKSITACIELSDTLTQIFESLKVDPEEAGPLQRIKASVRSYRKAGEIKDIDSRLVRLRTQICDQLNFGLLNELVEKEVSANAFRASALARLEKLTEQVTDLHERRIWDTSKFETRKKKEEAFGQFVDRISTISKSLPHEKRINRILKSLHFRQIKERISEVHEAHAKTFGWIFGREPGANVAEWMRSRDNLGIYWVSGYAGSGKSTLMKFLLNHLATAEALAQWSSPNSYIIASHFFWSAGTPIQKSQEGLLRTLIFQILLQHTDLIPILCPDRWAEDCFGHIEAWSREELCETFRRLAKLSDCPVRICLFVDGLDEYRGDHRELLALLYDISQSPHIKVCASSRPWIEFRQAFEKSKWTLAVQDLTSDDIRQYAIDKLCPEKPAYPWLENHDSSVTNGLADEICRKAQGVFLWVFLVVRSLLKGLANGDTFRDLRSRLEELPSDLEAYFTLMLDTIDTVYRRRTARIFMSLVHTDASLPILVFHFFDLEEENPNYIMENSIKHMSDSEVMAIVRPKRHQLIAQCRDLIKLTIDPHEPGLLRDRITFLHRTVSDFLRTSAMDALLGERAGTEFEPRVTLSKAFLAMVKSVPPWWLSKKLISIDRIRRFVLAILFYTSDLDALQINFEADVFLEELNSSLKLIFSPSEESPESYWNECFPGTKCQSIFEIQVRHGPQRSAEKALSRLSHDDKARLLQQSLCNRIIIECEEGFTFRIGDGINVESVEQLLQLGISPNLALDDDGKVTVWSDFLLRMHHNFDCEKYYHVCQLLAQHGTHSKVDFGDDKSRQGLTVKKILIRAFKRKRADTLMALMQQQECTGLAEQPAVLDGHAPTSSRLSILPDPNDTEGRSSKLSRWNRILWPKNKPQRASTIGP